MSELNWWKTGCAVFLVCATTTITSPAQTLTTLHSFDGTDGSEPLAGLAQAADGNLYGTTASGGASSACLGGCGTIFKISPSGTLTTIYNFCSQTGCTDGITPLGALLQATDGNLYGTTYSGGINGRSDGTAFKLSLGGKLTTLYKFCSVGNCLDGAFPHAALVQGSDGNFYGTTVLGGDSFSGTVFKIASGALTTLYSFCAQSSCTDGSKPYAGLVQGTDGNFYGTTYGGGTGSAGTVFKITPTGTLTTLYSFCSQTNCTDGFAPYGGVIQYGDGDFYGTTYLGGPLGLNGGGTVFKITPSGALTTLYSFGSQSGDGTLPDAGLDEGSDGDLYGTTVLGGAHSVYPEGAGTVYKVTPGGILTTLYAFCSQSGCPDGEEPRAAVMQNTNGSFYGTTSEGGTSVACPPVGCGTVFSLSVGLRPFVETIPTVGKVGRAVTILGTNIRGATSVTFNGTAATFTLISAAALRATVPAGATTGTVQVVTPSGTLSSNVPFRVAQ
jgi:uncharacterized repeat protein (TIGR03803 family)